MSKFLKIIVNLVVLVAIVVAAALLVPPFMGVDTVMNDSTETETNLPVGHVAYGRTVNVNDLEKGDKIIDTNGASAYVYEITDMDTSAGSYKVKDVYNENSDEEGITLQKSVSKVVVIVPFIGYAAIALQSREGLIIVGLSIAFLIILFILAELWRKDGDEEEDEEEEGEEEDEPETLSRKERRRLKKEEKRRRKEQEALEEEEAEEGEEEEEEEEETLSRKERRRLKKEEKRRRKLEKKELREEASEEEATEPEASQTALNPQERAYADTDIDAAMKEAMSSIAMGIAQVSEYETLSEEPEALAEPGAPQVEESEQEQEIEPEVQTESENSFADNNIEETAEEELVYHAESVVPGPTVAELLEKAQASGEAPEVVEDNENGVTLLDYSDIL